MLLNKTNKNPVSNKELLPSAIFDIMTNITKSKLPSATHWDFVTNDFDAAKTFLKEYDNNQATFNSYRREVERLLQWSWLIQKKSIFQIKRNDIEDYVNFCKNPPQLWIGIAKVPRFIDTNGERKPNPAWRPFVATVSKTAAKKGTIPDIKKYSLSEKAIREIFAILGSFYKFLVQENYTEINPVTQIRQKSKYFRKQQTKTVIRRLTELQWDTVIEIAKQLADVTPKKNERTLFIMSILYSMYLRISELTASKRWLPKMNDFRRDHDGNWWFTTVGKGNKERQIAVSDSMLDTLKRWRKYLNLTPLPSVNDQTPLIPNTRGEGAISSTNQIRNIVQYCFDEAIKKLREDGFTEEANGLQSATVHWLRHTGISDDIKRRPREHVRDDAGHSSSITTDKYIDVDLRERHSSAKKKLIDRDEILVQKNEPLISNHSRLKNKKKSIVLSLWLMVENNSKWVRGKKRAREDIEYYVLSDYNIKRLSKDSWDYEITVEYETEKELEDIIYSIYSEMQSHADRRNCFIEADISDKKSDRRW